MTTPIIFIVLLLIGFINAWHINHKRSRQQPLICPLNSDCEKVLTSKWSTLLGIHNEVWGMATYALVALMLIIATLVPALSVWGALFIVLLVTGGFLYSFFLLAVQLFVIRDFCFYCLLSSFIQIILFGLVVFFG